MPEDKVIIAGRVKFDFDYEGDLEAISITVTKDGQDFDMGTNSNTYYDLGDMLEESLCDHAKQGQEVEIILRLKPMEVEKENGE